MSDIAWRSPSELTREMVVAGRILVRLSDGDLKLCVHSVHVCNAQQSIQKAVGDVWVFATPFSRRKVAGFILID